MLGISSIYYLVVGFLSGPKANDRVEVESKGKILTDTLPPFDFTSFTEARYLGELNRLRQEELLRTSFTATPPREDFEAKEQAFLHRMQERISKMTEPELHNLVSSQENDPQVRCIGAAELVNRRDRTASLTFTWCIIADTDVTLRKICAIGLGELGRREDLQVLKNVQEEDWIYDDAQEAIAKIRANETGIKII